MCSRTCRSSSSRRRAQTRSHPLLQGKSAGFARGNLPNNLGLHGRLVGRAGTMRESNPIRRSIIHISFRFVCVFAKTSSADSIASLLRKSARMGKFPRSFSGINHSKIKSWLILHVCIFSSQTCWSWLSIAQLRPVRRSRELENLFLSAGQVTRSIAIVCERTCLLINCQRLRFSIGYCDANQGKTSAMRQVGKTQKLKAKTRIITFWCFIDSWTKCR